MAKKKQINEKLEALRISSQEQVKFLNETRRSINDNLAKAILTFSSAILTVSVAFLKDLIKDLTEPQYYFLIGGWIFLIVSILLIIASYIAGNSGLKHDAYNIEAYFENTVAYYRRKKNKEIEYKTYLSNKGSYLNQLFLKISAILFATGLISFVCFAILNANELIKCS